MSRKYTFFVIIGYVMPIFLIGIYLIYPFFHVDMMALIHTVFLKEGVDTITTESEFTSGLISPIIAIFAALLTYIAFLMQYKANEITTERISIEQVERIVFEYINMHGNNLYNMSVGPSIRSKEAFHFMFYEYLSLYNILKKIVREEKGLHLSNKEVISISFTCFYYGVANRDNITITKEIHTRYKGKFDDLLSKFIKEIVLNQKLHRNYLNSQKCMNSDSEELNDLKKELQDRIIYLEEYIDEGFSFRLYDGHMLRLDSYLLLVTTIIDYLYNSKIPHSNKIFLTDLIRNQYPSHALLIITLYSLYKDDDDWFEKGYLDIHKINLLKNVSTFMLQKVFTEEEINQLRNI